jgi:hypothetical protein
MIKATTGRWEITPLQLIIVLALMQLFIALFTNGFALSADEGMWHYIGRNWFRNGLVPYTGGADNKSPMIFAIFGLSDKLFGVNYWFPRVFGTICQSIGIFYIYKIAAKISGKEAGILAISFYGLSVLWHGADGRYVSYTETYEVMFVIISVYFFIASQNKKGAFISGLLLAIGLGFRFSAIFGILTLFIASFRKGGAYTLMFCSGVLSGVSFIVAIYLLAGINLHQVYFFTLADNFGTGSTSDHDFWWRMVQFFNMFFYSEVILFYPLVLGYFFITRKVDWLVLWLILEFAGINILGNYARVDLKELLPCLSLIGAFVVAHAIKIYNVPIKHVMLVIWICFSPKMVEPLLNFRRLFTGEFQKAENYCHEPFVQPDESASRQLGRWVKANTRVTDKVLVAGYGTQVQAYSERVSPTIYFCATQTPIAKERFFQDLNQTKPDMVLVPLFPEYRLYISADLRTYVDDMVVKYYSFDRCMFNYSIYRIKK